MQDVIVIGAGASGLIAAIFAAKSKKKVLLLERNQQCGKKILVTGNGRCNYFNDDYDVCRYITKDENLLNQIMTDQNRDDVLSFFESIGITPRIKEHYYYPYSNQAVSVKEALLLEAKLSHVQIQNDILVEDIVKEKDQFIINPKKDHLVSHFLILAAGSKASPKTGTDGVGYALVQKFGHIIEPVLPALVPLKGQASYLKSWSGVRIHAGVSLYEDGVKIKEEVGEVQLTEYGISGICVFNISGLVSLKLKEKKNIEVRLDFLPELALGDKRLQWFEKRNRLIKNRTIEQLLEGLIPYKLVSILLKIAKISSFKHWDELTLKEKETLIYTIKNFSFPLEGTLSYDRAQVCLGGVSLKEVNPDTMESLLCSNLYIVGEILDVCGDCGGYNLAFAWVSGMLAGKGVGE